MTEASPAKWHLAHTTWFFETFVLAGVSGYRPFDPAFNYLFNSYYEAAGPRHPRPQRGLLSRPTVEEIYRYRAHVDTAIGSLFAGAGSSSAEGSAPTLTLGLHHEQQHQELLLTDILHAFGQNPLKPAYRAERTEGRPGAQVPPMRWLDYPAGLRWIGHEGDGFAFDNEGPRHRVYLEAYRLADRLVTCGEYLAFINDGGYARPELWLSDGWAACRTHAWESPLYWERDGAGWRHFTLFGVRPVDPAEPVCHVSFYEADAFARWAGARLPTEAEWEAAAAAAAPPDGSEEPPLCPGPLVGPSDGLQQLDRDVWQWTASPYVAYPGFATAVGALGEYNGKPLYPINPKGSIDVVRALSEYNAKFMVNQMVLRGGSCATPRSHLRRTYRNFFPPEARWQFSGIRLAKNA
jgi:ergothioneine biosynthesis protein EgtB